MDVAVINNTITSAAYNAATSSDNIVTAEPTTTEAPPSLTTSTEVVSTDSYFYTSKVLTSPTSTPDLEKSAKSYETTQESTSHFVDNSFSTNSYGNTMTNTRDINITVDDYSTQSSLDVSSSFFTSAPEPMTSLAFNITEEVTASSTFMTHGELGDGTTTDNVPDEYNGGTTTNSLPDEYNDGDGTTTNSLPEKYNGGDSTTTNILPEEYIERLKRDNYFAAQDSDWNSLVSNKSLNESKGLLHDMRLSQDRCISYTLCDYCYFCASCVNESCGDCNMSLCIDIGTSCTCPLERCMSAECVVCKTDECMLHRECPDGYYQWDTPGIEESYDVAYHVIINNLSITVSYLIMLSSTTLLSL